MTRTRLSAPFAWLLVALLLLSGGTSSVMAQTPEASPQASPVADEATTHGIQIADMDLSVDPGDDFYQFANGGWLARTQLPADSARFGAFDELSDKVQVDLFAVMDGMETDPSTEQGKARTIFDQYIDMDTRDEQGVEPLQPILDQILAIESVDDGLAFHQVADTYGLGGLFAPYAWPSLDDATVMSGGLTGPILSLPSEEYYLDDSEEGQALRDAWIDATVQLLVILGYSEDEAQTAAEAVIALEMDLVGIKTPDVELYSDVSLMNNPRTLEELEELLPGMDWEAFVQESHLADSTEVLLVDDIAYFEALDGVLADTDPMALQALFATQLIWTYAPYLTTEIGEVWYGFVGGVLSGTTERAPIEERALTTVMTAFPDVLSQAYVAEHFPPEAKTEIEDLVDNLVEAFRIRIEQNSWMSEDTKAAAIEKLDLMVTAVGYPDSWTSYDDVEIGESLFESHLNAYQASNGEALGQVGQPVDRGEWFMNPFEVNAGYDPSRNMMIYPAAILQAPFFDPNADLASNYGGIGSVIGHEITHGFDLSGSQFDGFGNLVSWWAEEDYETFLALNDQVIEHYSAIEVQPGLFVDGEMSVGENVADMGGAQIAYDALLIALGSGGHSLAGEEMETPWFLTQQQRFFISVSTISRELSTPEWVEYLITASVYAPEPVRAVEPIRQMDAFHAAFNISEGDPMYLAPEDRIVIW